MEAWLFSLGGRYEYSLEFLAARRVGRDSDYSVVISIQTRKVVDVLPARGADVTVLIG